MRTSMRLVVIFLSIILITACGKKKTVEPETHDLQVEFSYAPNPATVNTEIALKFEVEDDGTHVNVTMLTCEIEKEGSGNHQEMTVHAHGEEAGHYEGHWTFTSTGEHEIHFGFMHGDDMEERKFSITVQ